MLSILIRERLVHRERRCCEGSRGVACLSAEDWSAEQAMDLAPAIRQGARQKTSRWTRRCTALRGQTSPRPESQPTTCARAVRRWLRSWSRSLSGQPCSAGLQSRSPRACRGALDFARADRRLAFGFLRQAPRHECGLERNAIGAAQGITPAQTLTPQVNVCPGRGHSADAAAALAIPSECPTSRRLRATPLHSSERRRTEEKRVEHTSGAGARTARRLPWPAPASSGRLVILAREPPRAPSDAQSASPGVWNGCLGL
jgi:hypothetical protein